MNLAEPLTVLTTTAMQWQAPITLGLHEGKPHTWNDLARAWSFEPVVVISLIVSGLLYAAGVRKLWRDSRAGRGTTRLEVIAFVGGWLALLVALVSPLHAWGRVLFSAHMTQHE